MITVGVQYFELVRHHVDVPDEAVRLDPGSTVRDLMARLTRRHGSGLADALVGPDGGPLPNAVILLDSGNILHRQGMEKHNQRARILVCAPDEDTARRLAGTLDFLDRGVDRWHAGQPLPSSFAPYRMLVCQLGGALERPDELLARLRQDAHVALLLPSLDVRWVAYHMRDPRVNHFLASPADPEDLRVVVEKLDTGAIFGLSWHLGDDRDVQYRTLHSFEQRRDALDDLETFAQEARLRGRLRRVAGQVTEELLMNAMYQAPVDAAGRRVFEAVEPALRVHERTPRPVSLRYAARGGSLYVSVRDRFGSLRRDTLAHYLLRCTTEEVQIEQKRLGAGLGLYIVASTASRVMVNILPGKLTETICVLERRPADPPLRVLSVTTQNTPD